MGSWWLLREVELGNACLEDVTVLEGTVHWSLPASKTDIKALGATRSHKCACGGIYGSRSLLLPSLCPACNMIDQVEWVKHTFQHKPHVGLPLFPTPEGNFATKAGMIAMVREAAEKLRLPLLTPSGAPAWGGHALRRGGAQYLAKSGVEVWRIQALARHSSQAILIYPEGTRSLALGDIAAEAAAGRSIEAMRAELRALQAEVESGKSSAKALEDRVSLSQAELVVNVLPSDILPELQESEPSSSTLPYVISTSGRAHVVDQKHSHLTLCKWQWRKAKGATPSASPDGGLWCLRCATAKQGDLSESADSSSQPESDSSSGSHP